MKKFLSLMTLFLLFSCGKNESDNLKSLNENELIAKMNEFYNNKDFIKTAECINIFVEKFPQDPKSPIYLKNLALIYTNDIKDINLAITQYKKIINQYPNSNEAPNAYFTLGFIYANELKDFTNAKYYYEEFIKRFPNHEAIESAKFELANLGKSPEEIINTIQNK